jgi:hypothetical protein
MDPGQIEKKGDADNPQEADEIGSIENKAFLSYFQRPSSSPAIVLESKETVNEKPRQELTFMRVKGKLY